MGAMALISYVLSLGSHLWVNKHQTGIPLPSAVLAHLPVIQGLLPARLSLFTSLFVAGMFAIGIDEFWRRWKRRQRFAWLSPTASKVIGAVGVAVLCGLVIITLVPRATVPTSATGPPVVPSFFSSTAADAIPAGNVVLTYPYVDSQSTSIFWRLFPAQSAMLDRAVAGMRFRLIGGYGWFPSSTGHFGSTSPALLEPQSVQAFFDVSFSGGTSKQRVWLSKSDLTRDLRVFFRDNVQTVTIVDPLENWRTIVRQVSAAIGSPSRVGGVILWAHVRQRLIASSVSSPHP